MSDRNVHGLVIFTAIILLLTGTALFFVFDMQGVNKNNNYINYNVDDYVEIIPLVFNGYSDVYGNIDVSKINISNLNQELVRNFTGKEEQIIGYIREYYNQIKTKDSFSNMSEVTDVTKSQINGTLLSVFHRVDFVLEDNILENSNMSHVITYNVDLAKNKMLTNDDLLSKYTYSKSYIAEKLFIDDILNISGQILTDKETNISLTKKDIERKKEYYIKTITEEFDNIITLYVDNGTLVLIYDKMNLKSMFFEGEFEAQIQERYLK